MHLPEQILATELQLKVDFGKQLKFPARITSLTGMINVQTSDVVSLVVVCRGLAGQSLCRMLTLLGITDTKREAIKSATEAVERATGWLWIKKTETWAFAAGTLAVV